MEAAKELEHAQISTSWITTLYQTYASRCLRCAQAVLKDPRLAEEAVQETWIKVIKLAQSTTCEDAEHQLFTILKHTSLDILKKEKRYVPLPEAWDTAEKQTDHNYLLQQIVRLIRALPEKYRQVLELKYLGEYTNREIARQLHLRESTVSTRVQRGREQLMNALKEEGWIDDTTGI